MDAKSEIIICHNEGGKTKIDVRMENKSVWLSQTQMVDLLGRREYKIIC